MDKREAESLIRVSDKFDHSKLYKDNKIRPKIDQAQVTEHSRQRIEIRKIVIERIIIF